MSVCLYITIGTIGIRYSPASGFGTLFGVTGGFIFGFIPFVLLCAAAKCKEQNSCNSDMHCGLLTCHLCGIIQFMIITGKPFIQTALTVSLPYLLKDIVSCILAYIISVKLSKVIAVE